MGRNDESGWGPEPTTRRDLRRPRFQDAPTEAPEPDAGFELQGAAREVMLADLTRDGRYDAPVEGRRWIGRTRDR